MMPTKLPTMWRIGAPVSALLSQPVHVAESEWRRNEPAAGSGVSFDVLVHVESPQSRYLLGINRFNAAILGLGVPPCSGLV
jgi:hypothetical protein